MSIGNIQSEIAPLKKAIFCKPQFGLQKITPELAHEYLFDDVLWIKKAIQQHDAFINALKGYGVEPYYLEHLLEDVLVESEARHMFIDFFLHYHDFGKRYRSEAGIIGVSSFIDRIMNLSNRKMMEYLLSGMLLSEAMEEGIFVPLALQTYIEPRTTFLIPPVPNTLFMRDNSFWLGKGVSISAMQFPARAIEPIYLKMIYKLHPLFKDVPIWYDGTMKHDEHNHQIGLEGGDVLVITGKTLLIGMGERTTPYSVQHLASKIFDQTNFQEILAVSIPQNRSTMHMDTIMTMVDDHTFTYGLTTPLNDLETHSLTKGSHGVNIKSVTFKPAVSKALGISEKDLRIITLSGTPIENAWEQWNDATNLLTVKPGVATIYQRDERFIEELTRHNVELIILDDTELGRGRGGGRCMTCPVLRSDT